MSKTEKKIYRAYGRLNAWEKTSRTIYLSIHIGTLYGDQVNNVIYVRFYGFVFVNDLCDTVQCYENIECYKNVLILLSVQFVFFFLKWQNHSEQRKQKEICALFIGIRFVWPLLNNRINILVYLYVCVSAWIFVCMCVYVSTVNSWEKLCMQKKIWKKNIQLR